MRKFIILTTFLLIGFACKKEDKEPTYCWTCNWEGSRKDRISGIFTVTTIGRRDTCNMTQAQAYEFEKEFTYITEPDPRIGNTVLKSVMTCEKQ